MSLSQARTRLIARLHRRRTREREGLVLAEGVRVAREAIHADAEVSFAVVSPRGLELGAAPLLDALRARGVDTLEVDDRTFAELAATETPQGLLLVCREPAAAPARLVRSGARLLALDGIQDPGNAGTLIRTAAAFGLDGVVALDGTVDPWNPRTVRAAAGTCFRVPVWGSPWPSFAPGLEAAGLRLFVADGTGEAVARRVPPPGWALVVGSEGAGARAEVRAVADRLLAVPMPGGTESLNAGIAGAILMFALTRDDDAS